MLSINPNERTERENYKLMTGAIIPRPIAFVTTKSSEGIVNAAPFSYFNIVSANPPLISISVQRKDGQPKDTARNIYAIKQLVVHLTSEQNVDMVNETAASLAYNDSELARTNLTEVASEVIDVPGILEAPFRMECTLEKAVTLDEYPTFDLFIVKVERFHIEEAYYDMEKGYVDEHGLQAVSRLAGNHYAKLGDIFTRARPK